MRTWTTAREREIERAMRLERIEFLLETMCLALRLTPPDVAPAPVEPETEEVYTS